MRVCLPISVLLLFFVFLLPTTTAGQGPPKQQGTDQDQQKLAADGKELFTGEIPFAKGGPPCSSCHTLTGLPLPAGKIRGPDLTHEFSKLGSDGMDAALQLLPFPDMLAFYQSRPLTSEEQGDLKAFLKETDEENPVIPSIPPGSPENGEALFAGRVGFQRGGPPCSSCHSVAGLPFPEGGTLGPDLTHTYSKLGPEGVDTALETLFFPAMTPLYEAHQLTPAEQSDLKAFFQQEDLRQPQGSKVTIVLAFVALAGFVLWVILAAAFWRNRLRGVRKRLVESVSR